MSCLFALLLSVFASFGLELPVEQWDLPDNALMMCSGDTEVDSDGDGDGEGEGEGAQEGTGTGSFTFTPSGSQDRERIYNGF